MSLPIGCIPASVYITTSIFDLFDLLFYVNGKQLRSCRDGAVRFVLT